MVKMPYANPKLNDTIKKKRGRPPAKDPLLARKLSRQKYENKRKKDDSKKKSRHKIYHCKYQKRDKIWCKY